MEEHLEILQHAFASVTPQEYRKSEPIPRPLDHAVRAFVRAFVAAPTAERETLHAGLDGSQRTMILRYALRMMTLARRKGAQEPLIDALIALGMRMPSRDSEASDEDTRALCLCCHVAAASGFDRRTVFARAARSMVPKAAQHLLAFAKQPPDKQTLEASGLREHDTPYGVIYVGLW
jgi:hypothetical protein